MYIDDRIKGAKFIMESEFAEPFNLPSDQLVTINPASRHCRDESWNQTVPAL
jgi:hypothetical protein